MKSKLLKVPSPKRNVSDVNLVTWRDVVAARDVAESCVSEVLRDVESFVGGKFYGVSACSVLSTSVKATDEELREDRRLVNWKRWIAIRQRESDKIRRFTYRPRNEMLVNMNPNVFRAVQKRKEIVDKSKTAFGELSFWKTPVKSRKDLYATLPKSESSVTRPPEIVYTQTPDAVLREQRIKRQMSARSVLEPIKEKIEQQPVQLFEPDLDEIALKGNVVGGRRASSEIKRRQISSIKLTPKNDKLKKIVRPQVLVISGIRIDNEIPDKNVLIDLAFESFKLTRQTKTIRVENLGEIAMNLSYTRADDDEHFPFENLSKSFVFDKFTIRLVPGEAVELPFYFYATQVGVFKEKWIVNCEPEFSKECQICVNLFGYCKKKFKIEDQLAKIESEIMREAAEYDVGRTIKDLMKLTVIERSAPSRELFTDPCEISFKAMNPKLYYYPEIVENLAHIYDELNELTELQVNNEMYAQQSSNNKQQAYIWDYNIESLYQIIINHNNLNEQKSFYDSFLANLNQLKTPRRQHFTIDDESSAKFSMVRNALGMFLAKFDLDPNDERERCDLEQSIKRSLCAVVDKMICILES